MSSMCKQLLLDIEKKRKEMMKAAKERGFLSEITIKHSQELDNLLNKYQQK
ncbi:aspartyl-phosphate phosphatase Spo0E family protein [Bacillus solimangrovi]|uniref:aspartyl-phosphate phosphatase Spo0E family protein n=1 Tax=Bacillus solimangrovi TaxID=1305675 RepID=UPI001FE0DB63|nr:aspartyl-phosphate phosphatase Spo0E family protein [Bacillus solimangrovi]